MELRRRLITATLSLVIVTLFSVVGYQLLGGARVGFLQALYMAVITVAGVGYGEFVDTSHSIPLRVFNMFVVLIGVAICAYVYSSITAFLVEGDYSDVFRRRKMLKRITQLKDHIIICGMGDTGRHVLTEMHKTGTPYVAIDIHEDNIKRLQEHFPETYKDMLYVVGDATDEEILESAGVDRASGLVSTLAHDKDNLVVTVMVRQRSDTIRIVARCTDLKFSERMQKAGANSVVSPNMIGGLRLASETLRPHVVGFLDMMLREQSRTLRIEEIVIKENSPWAGKQLHELNLRTRYNLLPMALKNAQNNLKGQNFWVNPQDNVLLKSAMVIIVLGDVVDIRKARADADSKAGVFSAMTS